MCKGNENKTPFERLMEEATAEYDAFNNALCDRYYAHGEWDYDTFKHKVFLLHRDLDILNALDNLEDVLSDEECVALLRLNNILEEIDCYILTDGRSGVDVVEDNIIAAAQALMQ